MVDVAYVINLNRSKDRMLRMHDQCLAQGLDYTRIEAVDGRALKRAELGDIVTDMCRGLCTSSMLGCALSHMNVWKRIVSEGHSRALILEDDAELVPDFRARMVQALVDCPVDFDILLLGCFFLCSKNRDYEWPHKFLRMLIPHKLRKDSRVWGSVFVPEYFGGTHCYIVSLEGAKKLLRLLPKVGFHIDAQMNNQSLNVYAASPDLAYQRNMSESSMASYSFPKTLMPTLSRLKDSKNVSAAYYLDAPIGQVLERPINAWTFLFFILGVCVRSHVSLGVVAGFFVVEMCKCGDVGVPVCAFVLGKSLQLGLRFALKSR